MTERKAKAKEEADPCGMTTKNTKAKANAEATAIATGKAAVTATAKLRLMRRLRGCCGGGLLAGQGGFEVGAAGGDGLLVAGGVDED